MEQWQLAALQCRIIGAGKERRRHGKGECLGGLEIGDELKICRLFDRYIAGIHPTQNLIHIVPRAPEQIGIAWSTTGGGIGV